jgi:predicted methyltransferase
VNNVHEAAGSKAREPLTARVHALIRERVEPGCAVIDATVGNGNDSVALAEAVGPAGHVYGFDIQDQAIATAHVALARRGLARRVTLLTACHSRLGEHIPEGEWTRMRCAIFNLGYLPGGDKTITTQKATSIQALHAAFEHLQPGAFISILCYPGHAEGLAETAGVISWIETLRLRGANIEIHEGSPPKSPGKRSPIHIVVEKSA